MSDYLRQAKELCPEDTRLATIEGVADALEAAEKRGRVAGLREAASIAEKTEQVLVDAGEGATGIPDDIERRAEEVERS